MITSQRIGRILFIAFACATSLAFAATASECDERVSPAQLIASSAAYQGRALWVIAHVTIDFENMSACPSENETRAGSCLWLNVDDGPFKTDQDYARYQSKLQIWKQFNLQTVAIHATFDQAETGHFGMWPGGLRNVTEMSAHQGGWSFATNAAVPRTACVAELSAPIESGERRLAIGYLKFRNGDYDGAIVDFSRAIELDPGNSRHYLMRGNAKKQQRDYASAIADYTRAIEFEREYQEVMFTARAGARELAGDLDGAIADYSRAIELEPKFDGTYRLRGLVKQKKGDHPGAAADFMRAQQMEPAR